MGDGRRETGDGQRGGSLETPHPWLPILDGHVVDVDPHSAMDHNRTIQELVDEHKQSMPTGVVTDIMKECQEAFEALPKLWRVTFIHVTLDVDNSLLADKKTMIVEEVAAPNAPRNWFQVFDTATIPPVEMHDRIGGDYVHEGRSAVRIVIKVESCFKRAREA